MSSFLENIPVIDLTEAEYPEKEKRKKRTQDDDRSNAYTAIVIDPEVNAFKVIKGKYNNKKEVYDKLSDRGYVVRKVLETPIFDWIEKNADSNIEAYAMFSTAFSKWRGNNMLSDDYVELLNSIPHLNRERRKGDPNTKGKAKKGWGESVKAIIQEAGQYYQGPEVDTEFTSKHDLTIYPINKDGERDPEYASNPIKMTINTFDTDDPKKRFDDPKFYRKMFKLMKIDAIGGRAENGKATPHPSFDIVVDSDYEHPVNLTSQVLLSHYQQKNKNPNYVWYPSKTPHAAFDSIIKKLKQNQDIAGELGFNDEYKALGNQIANLEKLKANEIRSNNKTKVYTPQDQENIKNAKIDNYIAGTLTKPKGLRKDSPEYAAWRKERYAAIADTMKATDAAKADAERNTPGNQKYNKLQRDIAQDELQTRYDALVQNGIRPGNPLHNSNFTNEFAARLDSKERLRQKLDKVKGLMQDKKPVKLKNNEPEHKGPEINDNLAKKLGYDPSLDMAPYRKKEEATFVNDGADLNYFTQPSPNMIHGGPIKLGGSIYEGNMEEAMTHGELNQKLFDRGELRADVREALIKIASDFKEDLDLPFDPVDVYFTGSSANYNYNEASDIDLHLVYNFEDAGVNAELLKKYLVMAKKDYNDKYAISVKGIPVELGAENTNEPLVSSGIYSLRYNKWVKAPDNANKEIADPDMPYYEQLVNEIESAIQSQDSQVIGDLWKKLGNLRKTSLAQEGEFGAGNALFKKLRAEQYLKRLKDAYYNSKGNELSLESLEEIY